MRKVLLIKQEDTLAQQLRDRAVQVALSATQQVLGAHLIPVDANAVTNALASVVENYAREVIDTVHRVATHHYNNLARSYTDVTQLRDALNNALRNDSGLQSMLNEFQNDAMSALTQQIKASPALADINLSGDALTAAARRAVDTVADIMERAEQRSRAVRAARTVLRYLGYPRTAGGVRQQVYSVRETTTRNLSDPNWWSAVFSEILKPLNGWRKSARESIANAVKSALEKIKNDVIQLAVSEIPSAGFATAAEQRIVNAILEELRNAVSGALSDYNEKIENHADTLSATIERAITQTAENVRRAAEGAGAQQPTTPTNIQDALTILRRLQNDVQRMRAPVVLSALKAVGVPTLRDIISAVVDSVADNMKSNAQSAANQLRQMLDAFYNSPRADIGAFISILDNMLPFFRAYYQGADRNDIDNALVGLRNALSQAQVRFAASPQPPAGGAQRVAKAAPADPWRALRRMQPKYTPPKQVTQIMLWLPRLTEAERNKLTAFLYRYWLAVDKDERKQALKDLIRVAKEMGIPVKG